MASLRARGNSSLNIVPRPKLERSVSRWCSRSHNRRVIASPKPNPRPCSRGERSSRI